MATINVISPGVGNNILPNFQTALSSAVNGDTIQFPAGAFEFGNNSLRSVSTTKKVSLKGAGSGFDGTILYRPETISDANLGSGDEMIELNINQTGNSGIIVEDIWFKSKFPRLSTDGSDTGSEAPDRCLRIKKAPGTIVRNCRFNWFGHSALEVTQYIQSDYDNSQYLIYNNIFDHCVKVDSAGGDNTTLGYGVEVYGTVNDNPWNGGYAEPLFGTEYWAFVERNLFLESRHAIVSNSNGMYVFRYNTCVNFYMNQAVDFHGTTASSGPLNNGTLATEIYNNLIVNTAWNNVTVDPIYQDYWTGSPTTSPPVNIAYRANGARGGKSYIHNNIIRGYQYAIGFRSDNTGSVPRWCQVGYQSIVSEGTSHTGNGTNERKGDVYYDNNTHDILISGVSGGMIKNDTSGIFVANRDYHDADYYSITPTPSPATTYTFPHPWRPAEPPTTIYLANLTSLWLLNNNANDQSATSNDLTETAAADIKTLSFETDLSEFSATSGSNITQAGAAALNGSSGGVNIHFDGTTGQNFGRIDLASAYSDLFLEFYFDPNSVTMTNGTEHRLAALAVSGVGGSHHAQIRFGQDGSGYYLKIVAWDDADAETASGTYTLSDAEHKITLRFVQSSGAGNDDGVVILEVDDVEVLSVEDLDNDVDSLNQIFIGAFTGVDTTTTGDYYIDEIRVYNSRYRYNSTIQQEGSHCLELTNAYASIPHGSQSGLNADTFSIFARVRFNRVWGTEQNVFGKYDYGSNDRGFRLGLQNGHWIFTISEDGTNKYDLFFSEPVIDTWYFIALSFNANTGLFKVYLDGEMANCRFTQYEGIYNNVADFILGGIENNGTVVNRLDGFLDEVGYAPTELTELEMADLDTNGVNISSVGAVPLMMTNYRRLRSG